MTLLSAIVLAACGVAAITDLRSRRIPNALTLSLGAAVLLLRLLQGWSAFGTSLAVLVVVFVLGSLAFSMGWLGGGDVKLAAVAAAAFGFPDALPFLLYTSIGGGILAIAVSIACGRLGATLGNVSALVRPMIYRGTVAVAPARGTTLPYALAIAFGAVAVVLSHTALPILRLSQ
ncbi:MAG: A24 family peptidase [Vulcanimicrobiaceae bacterium]